MTQAYIDSLPDDTTFIDLSCRNLTILPDLSRFYNLLCLNCYNNQLITLPPFNNSLQRLYCHHNKLITLNVKECKKKLNCLKIKMR